MKIRTILEVATSNHSSSVWVNNHSEVNTCVMWQNYSYCIRVDLFLSGYCCLSVEETVCVLHH